VIDIIAILRTCDRAFGFFIQFVFIQFDILLSNIDYSYDCKVISWYLLIGCLSKCLQNLIFRFLQSRQKIQIWLYDHSDVRIEGRLIGFDEYMNLVLDEAEEVSVKRQTRKALGRILLKGDNITLMTAAKS